MSQRLAACGRSDMLAMIAFRWRRFKSATGISPQVSGAASTTRWRRKASAMRPSRMRVHSSACFHSGLDLT